LNPTFKEPLLKFIFRTQVLLLLMLNPALCHFVMAAEALVSEDHHDIPYVSYEGSARRIIVQASLNERINAPLAIDTGSPGTIISMALAKRLGLLDDDAAHLWTVARGIGGSSPAIFTIIDTIKIGDIQQQFFLTTVVPSISTAFEGVLGMDYLSAYTTHIDSKRHVFSLQEMQTDSELYGGRDENWWRSTYQQLSSFRVAWKNYSERLEQAIVNSNISAGGNIEEAKRALSFSKQQFENAVRLFDKLDRYAIQLQVPMPWREY